MIMKLTRLEAWKGWDGLNMVETKYLITLVISKRNET